MRVIRSKRKSIALVIETDGSLTVRAPLHVTQAQITALVEQKATWISQKQALVRQRQPQAVRFAAGEQLPYLGRHYPLEIVARRSPLLALEDGRFRLAQSAGTRALDVFEAWYRAQAQQYIGQHAAALAAQFGLPYSGLRISAARGRWGSCSGRGGLNFSWRLMLAPPAAVEYVIIHELAHLQVRSHAPQFWQLVARMLPNYTEQRQWLKIHGPAIMAWGDPAPSP